MILLKKTPGRKRGLNSNLHFQCTKCQFIGKFDSCPANQKRDINYDAVLGATLAGVGFSQLEKLLGNMNMSCMSSSHYSNRQKLVQDDLEHVAKKCMLEAAEEEKVAAIDRGSVDQNGTPIVTVVVDGTWSKRSYGANYSALSGTAVIIGHHTKKVLWIGVKNKYCKICATATGDEPKEHQCNSNYKGPSTGMESDLILEGFQKSEAEYGIRYGKLVGDGDSHTFKKLTDSRIYRNPLKIEKN